MKKSAWIRGLIRWAIGLLTGFLAYQAAVAMDRSSVPAVLMGVVAGVAATLLVETWQTNRRNRPHQPSSPPHPEKKKP